MSVEATRQRIITACRAAMRMAQAENPDGEVFSGEWRAAEADRIEPDYNVWFPAVAPKVFSHPFAWFHKLFLDWYWPLLKLRAAGEMVPEDIPLASLLCLGRGLGKSALLEGVSLAEGAHFGDSFGLYVSSTEKKAIEHLQTVRALIESSEIARYYPGLAKPRIGKYGNQRGWRGDALYTASGFTMIAVSLEAGVRGLRDLERRPSFITMDDIDERDDSLATKQSKFDSLSKDVVPMLAPYGLVLFAQNLIYSGSVMDDTINRKLDWFHLRHRVGPVNTFRDDLDIEKRDGRPVIVSGTPNWDRIDRAVGQDMLNKAGEESFWIECQNKTSPSPEKRVWSNFDELHHVISWSQFASVFGMEQIPSDFELYAGYDCGTTGPDRHPAVFSIAAVAPEHGPLFGDLFVFYEFVANALQDEHDQAKALIEDLAKLCAHYSIQEAARLVKDSYREDMPESRAWDLRAKAGRMIPFKVFKGSHEASSERRTFNTKWGLPIIAGNKSKTAGLSQLRFYLKLESQPHPFKPHAKGKPNLYMVVADDQLNSAKDRFGLQRHRWEAANLKWDVNTTTRDVPTKFGDDATDALKFYLANFAPRGLAKTEAERLEEKLPPELRSHNAPDYGPGWDRDGWELGRMAVMRTIKKQQPGYDDPWNPRTPREDMNNDPWNGS